MNCVNKQSRGSRFESTVNDRSWDDRWGGAVASPAGPCNSSFILALHLFVPLIEIHVVLLTSQCEICLSSCSEFCFLECTWESYQIPYLCSFLSLKFSHADLSAQLCACPSHTGILGDLHLISDPKWTHFISGLSYFIFNFIDWVPLSGNLGVSLNSTFPSFPQPKPFLHSPFPLAPPDCWDAACLYSNPLRPPSYCNCRHL